MERKEIVVYTSEEGTKEIEVRLVEETLWLSLNDLAKLFGRDKSVISRHLKNAFSDGEIDKNSVVANYATTADDGKTYNVDHYNLDAIITVGCRVRSREGTLFRIWARGVLKEHLLKGQKIRQKQLTTESNNFKGLMSAVRLAKKTSEQEETTDQEQEQLRRIIVDYSYALETLEKYDNDDLEISKKSTFPTQTLTYEEAKAQVELIKEIKGYGGLFGKERDELLKGCVGTIYQTVFGEEAYKTVEEKAAMLLYSIIKIHPFSDGNKRIATLLFLYFLEKNGILLGKDGSRKIENNALVALALMIAISKSEDKDIMLRLVANLINEYN